MIAAKFAVIGIQPEPSRRQPAPASPEPENVFEGAFARLLDAGSAEVFPPGDEAGKAPSDALAGDSLDKEHTADSAWGQPIDLPAMLTWQEYRLTREKTTSASEPHEILKDALAGAIQHAERHPPAGGLVASSAARTAHLCTAMADLDAGHSMPVVALRLQEGPPELRPETTAGDYTAAIGKAASHDHADREPDSAAQRDGKSSAHGEAVQDTAKPLAAPATIDPAVPPSPARQIVEALKTPLAELTNRFPAADARVPAKQLQIVLQPDHLGEVSVTLRLERSRLQVTITAERPDTATLLLQDRTALDGILQGVASEAISVSIAVRESEGGGTSGGTQHDTRGGGPSNHSGTMGQRGEGRSFPDKASGARQRRLEESIHEERRTPDPSCGGIVVI